MVIFIYWFYLFDLLNVFWPFASTWNTTYFIFLGNTEWWILISILICLEHHFWSTDIFKLNRKTTSMDYEIEISILLFICGETDLILLNLNMTYFGFSWYLPSWKHTNMCFPLGEKISHEPRMFGSMDMASISLEGERGFLEETITVKSFQNYIYFQLQHQVFSSDLSIVRSSLEALCTLTTHIN